MAVAIPGDISNEKFCAQLVKQAHKKLGGLDIPAVVAGRQHAVDKIADVTTKQWRHLSRERVCALFGFARQPFLLCGPWLHHHYSVDPGDPPPPEHFGSCPNQSGDFGLHTRTCKAGS